MRRAGRSAQRRHLAPFLVLVAAASCQGVCTQRIGPPSVGTARKIESWLRRDYAAPVAGAPVLRLTYTPPTGAGRGRIRVRLVPDGALPPAGLRPACPWDAVAEPGLYFGTFDVLQGKPRYLARLGTPGAGLGEGEDASGRFGGACSAW